MPRKRLKLTARREALGLSQEQLLELVGVKHVRTIQRWESGESSPSPQHRKKLAEALQVSLAELEHLLLPDTEEATTRQTRDLVDKTDMVSTHPLSIKISRFVPFFAGPSVNSRVLKRNLRECQIEGDAELYVQRSWAVLVVRLEKKYASCVDYLMERRSAHLHIIEQGGRILSGARQDAAHPVFSDLPGIQYVMSVHQLRGAEDTHHPHLQAMLNPSLAGLTDDPGKTAVDKDTALEMVAKINQESPDAVTVRAQDATYLATWANVILLDESDHSSNFEELEQAEAHLQKLWYQLDIYDQYLSKCIREPQRYDFAAMQDDILNARIELNEFRRLNSTGSTCSNALRRALLDTSGIQSIADSISEKISLIGEK